MSIYYYPQELAAFIRMENYTVLEEFKFIAEVWSRRDEFLDPKDWKSLASFRHAVTIEQILQRSSLEEVLDVMDLMDETENHYTADDYFVDYNQIESVLKILKLQLLFSLKKGYKTIKVRTLLFFLHKKRRSPSMVKELECIFNVLGITLSLKGEKSCSLGTVALDDYIVLRLK